LRGKRILFESGRQPPADLFDLLDFRGVHPDGLVRFFRELSAEHEMNGVAGEVLAPKAWLGNLYPRPMGDGAPSDGAGAGPYPARDLARDSGILLSIFNEFWKEAGAEPVKEPKFHSRAQRAV
jgi:hypothetical protein